VRERRHREVGVLCRHRVDKTAQTFQNAYSGKNFIAERAQVVHSTIVDTIVYPDTIIKNCQLANCVIDKGCHLENLDLSYKVIRQNTKLVG